MHFDETICLHQDFGHGEERSYKISPLNILRNRFKTLNYHLILFCWYPIFPLLEIK